MQSKNTIYGYNHTNLLEYIEQSLHQNLSERYFVCADVQNKTIFAHSLSKCDLWSCRYITKKSRLRETKNLLTDADSRTDTILERLIFIFFLGLGGGVDQ